MNTPCLNEVDYLYFCSHFTYLQRNAQVSTRHKSPPMLIQITPEPTAPNLIQEGSSNHLSVSHAVISVISESCFQNSRQFFSTNRIAYCKTGQCRQHPAWGKVSTAAVDKHKILCAGLNKIKQNNKHSILRKKSSRSCAKLWVLKPTNLRC